MGDVTHLIGGKHICQLLEKFWPTAAAGARPAAFHDFLIGDSADMLQALLYTQQYFR